MKALNSEIKAKRETVDSVLRDNEACVNSIRVSKAFAIFNHIQFNKKNLLLCG